MPELHLLCTECYYWSWKHFALVRENGGGKEEVVRAMRTDIRIGFCSRFTHPSEMAESMCFRFDAVQYVAT